MKALKLHLLECTIKGNNYISDLLFISRSARKPDSGGCSRF